MTELDTSVPYYLAYVQANVKSDVIRTVLDLANDGIQQDEHSLTQPQKLAASLLLGAYIERAPDGSFARGEPVLPDELPGRGVKLPRKSLDMVISAITESVQDAVEPKDLDPKSRPHARTVSRDEPPVIAIKVYEGKIKQHEILSRAEQAELGYKIQKGETAKREIAALSKEGKTPDRDRQGELNVSIYNGQQAINKLVTTNLRFARHKVMQSGVWRVLGLDDTLQVASEAMISAAKGWDPDKGSFLTYAAISIRNKIKSAIADTGSMIRLPHDLHNSYQNVRHFINDFVSTNGRYPSTAEVFNGTGVGEYDYNIMRRADHPASLDNVLELIENSLKADDNTGRYDRTNMPDELIVPDVYDEVESRALKDEVTKALESLSEREAGVIRDRFGIGPSTQEPMTLDEVGLKYGVLRERVRQIEAMAMAKLRRQQVDRSLSDFLR